MKPMEKWNAYSKTIKATVFLWLVIDITVIWQIVVNHEDRSIPGAKYCFRFGACVAQSQKFLWEIVVFVILNLLMYAAWKMVHKQTKDEENTDVK